MKEEIKNKIENPNRIPLSERMGLQSTVVQKLYDKYCKEAGIDFKNLTKADKEKFRREKQTEILEKYRNEMSNIIDNLEYPEIRSLIMDKKYDEAAEKVIDILKKEEMVGAASL